MNTFTLNLKSIRNNILHLLMLVPFITFSQSDTMYWIGGAGNWSDLSHWSYSSGVPSIPLPSAIPTTNTNVVFDHNSGLSGTGAASTRTVTVSTEYIIKSLTFASTLVNTGTNTIIINRGTNHMRVTGDVNMHVGVTISSASDSYLLVMQPAMGETSTLTLNGHAFNVHFHKEGAGVTNVVGTITSGGRFNIAKGVLNYSATTFRAGNMTFSNDGVGNFNNVITFHTTGACTLNNTSVFNLPDATYFGWTVTANGALITNHSALVNMPLVENILMNYMTLNSTAPLDLLSLQTLTLGGNMNAGSVGAILNLSINGGLIANINSWEYQGDMSAGNTEFIVRNGMFRVKNNTNVYKVTIKNPTTASNIYGVGTIDELIFENVGATFHNNKSIGIFTPAASNGYTINNGMTITITGTVTATTPDCVGYWSLVGGGIGQSANFNNNTGATLELKNVTLARINANNTSNLTEVIGVDAEVNTGNIIFVEPVAKNIYWVGTSGNHIWNDASNWSATSGGVGGYCVPTRYDNVYFDNGSIVTAPITSATAQFHDIFIQDDAPVNIRFTGGNMGCFGSWYMRSGVSFLSSSVAVVFYATDLTETITSNGSAFWRVHFRGVGGWILQDDFKSNEHVYFQGGTLNTNSQSVYITSNFYGQEATLYPTVGQGGYRSLILGASTLSINQLWEYNHTSNSLNAGTSHIVLRHVTPYLRVSAGHTYYDVSTLPGNDVFRIEGGTVTFNCLKSSTYSTLINPVFTADSVIYSRTPTSGIQVSRLVQSATIGTLTLSPNMTFQMDNNRQLTILEDIVNTTPNCSGLMTLTATNASTTIKFNLVKSSGSIHINNVDMRGVYAQGGATFSADGIDLINNSGWTFVSPTPKELYWVGFVDNNWNNGDNWTTNTDGTPSGGCVPTRYDNVNFNSYSTMNLPINILNQAAVFNNLVAHSGTPSNIIITYGAVMEAYSYGDLIQMGPNMVFTRLHLLGGSTGGQVISSGAYAQFGNLTINNATSEWILTGDFRVTSTYTQTSTVSVTMNVGTYTATTSTINAGNLTINGSSITNSGVFTVNTLGKVVNLNVPLYTSSNQISVNAGTLIMKDMLINTRNLYANNNNVTVLDIRNSIFNLTTDWAYLGSNKTLYSDNSEINLGQTFTGQNGHVYNIIRTSGGTTANNYTIVGNLTINKLELHHSRQINGSNTIGTLILAPRDLTLRLNGGTTQTITTDLFLNGSPCMFNTLLGVSTSANIHYANPNNHNRYDYVIVGRINATNANLEFDVNSSVYPSTVNNNKVIFLSGSPGLVGLGNDILCRIIDPADPSTYTISANGFYGGTTSTYKWYKKNTSGVWVLLNVPSTTSDLNVLNHGKDGEYRCVIVYDSTITVGSQCNTNDVVQFKYTVLPQVTLTTSSSSICHGNTIQLGGNVIAKGPWTLTLSNGQTITGVDSTAWTANVTPTTTTSYSITDFDDECGTHTGSGTATITLPPNSNNLSIDGESASCISTGSGWIQFRNSTSGRLLVAIDLQGNNLGEISATSYVQNPPFSVAACGNVDPVNVTAVMGRRWVITPDNQPVTPVKVRLYFDDNEFQSLIPTANSNLNPFDDVFAITDLQLSKYHNEGSPLVNSNPHDNCASGVTTIWSPQGSGVISTILSGFDVNGRYTEYEVSDFSEFWLHGSSIMSPLAVELSKFEVSCENNGSKKIVWTTEQEKKSSHFIVESS